jgi:hypothetical protein
MDQKRVFIMKKTFKILGIIAFTALIGFSMTACPPEETEGPPPPEKFLTVTGIPSEHIGKIGAVKLYTPGSPPVVTVYSTMEKINGDSITFPLYNWAGENPWQGSGNYKITIFIFQDRKAAALGQPIYKGVTTEEIVITEPTTAIEWSSFTKS